MKLYTLSASLSPKCFKGVAMPSFTHAIIGPGIFRR